MKTVTTAQRIMLLESVESRWLSLCSRCGSKREGVGAITIPLWSCTPVPLARFCDWIKQASPLHFSAGASVLEEAQWRADGREVKNPRAPRRRADDQPQIVGVVAGWA